MLNYIKKRKTLIACCTIIVAIALILSYVTYNKTTTHQFTIGIIQTASHPALDATRQGFIDYLTEKLGNNKMRFIIKNAQGVPSQAHLIAQSFQGDEQISGIFAIATLAAQAAHQESNSKPLFIAAVTDPAAININPQKDNACGVPDTIDPTKQVTLLRALVPTAKSIVLLYNIGEINAQVSTKGLQDAFTKAGYQVELIGITQSSDIPLVIDRALQNGDVLMTPLDNMVVGAMPFLAHKAIDARKPLFATDNPSVKEGALAAAGVNYYDLGRQTGTCAFDVLTKKKTAGEIGFLMPIQQFVVNETTLKKLGLPKPALPSKIIEFVY